MSASYSHKAISLCERSDIFFGSVQDMILMTVTHNQVREVRLTIERTTMIIIFLFFLEC